jgi:hypothetical protein
MTQFWIGQLTDGIQQKWERKKFQVLPVHCMKEMLTKPEELSPVVETRLDSVELFE